MSKPSKKLSSSTKHYKLTLKQEKFCLEYIKIENATEAYRRVYSYKNMKEATINRNAHKLLKNNKIETRLAELMAPVYKKTELTAEYIVNNIIEIGERCMQRVPVMVREGKDWVQKMEHDEEGNYVGVWEFKEGGALKAQELLGRHMALFTDNHVYKGDKDNPVVIQDYDSLSTQEKLRILNERISKGKTK